MACSCARRSTQCGGHTVAPWHIAVGNTHQPSDEDRGLEATDLLLGGAVDLRTLDQLGVRFEQRGRAVVEPLQPRRALDVGHARERARGVLISDLVIIRVKKPGCIEQGK